jgi:hypothetical protein
MSYCSNRGETMNRTISPSVRKTLALTVLLVCSWAILNLISIYISARLNLRDGINELQASYSEIIQRRVDIGKLEEQLSSLLASPAAQHSAIVAGNDREALNQLMQTVRQSLEQVQGKLLSLTESAASRGSPAIAVQVRARMNESRVPQWLALIDGGGVRPRLHEITITSQSENGSGIMELDISATLKAPWISPKDKGS